MAIAVPSGMIEISSPGLTSSPSSRKSASWATHARPSWNVMIVRRAGEVALPITTPAMNTARKPVPCSVSAPP